MVKWGEEGMRIINEVDAKEYGEYDFVMGSEEDRIRAGRILVGKGYMVGRGVDGDFRVTVNTEWRQRETIPDMVVEMREAIEAG